MQSEYIDGFDIENNAEMFFATIKEDMKNIIKLNEAVTKFRTSPAIKYNKLTEIFNIEIKG